MAYGLDSTQAAAQAAPSLQALLGSGQHTRDKVIGDRGDSVALFGRDVLPGAKALTNHSVAVLREVRAEAIHDRPRLEGGAPGLEFREMLIDQRFRARNFGFASALVPLDDLAQVVDVIEIEIVEPGGFGGHIARHAKVDHENGAAIAILQRALE